jgi:hypothetical protein
MLPELPLQPQLMQWFNKKTHFAFTTAAATNAIPMKIQGRLPLQLQQLL